MTKLFKRIIICLLVVTCVFAITSCKGNGKNNYKYPSEVPTLTNNKDGIFLQVGDLKVTNQELYQRLFQSYGYDELKNYIDNSLLPELSPEKEEEFKKYLEESIYGTEELDDTEKQEALDAFKLNCISNGLHFEAEGDNDPLFYENVYRLEYRRYIYTFNQYVEKLEKQNADAENDETINKAFTDTTFVEYFNTNYHPKYTAIIVTFASNMEANQAMKSCSVEPGSDWANPEDTMKQIYQNAYGKAYEETEYSYEDLRQIKGSNTIDNVIAQYAVNCAAGDYTHAPIAFNGRWFLMYVKSLSSVYYNDIDETATIEASKVTLDDNNIVTELDSSLTEKGTDFYNEVMNSLFNFGSTNATNLINKALFELRQQNGLEIFAEGLEITYRTAFEKVYSDLDITEYEGFKATENTSSTLVAKWNGGELSVDKMFSILANRYGAMISLLFVEQYAVLNSKYNTVINYATKEILDQTKYNEYAESDFNTYKKSFEEGGFESYGYPASYGWDHFLSDYIGLTNEKDIVCDFNSSLYEDVVDLLAKSLYRVEAEDIEVVEISGFWALRSAKWGKDYMTSLESSISKPTVSIAWTVDDIKVLPTEDGDGKAITYEKNEWYGHIILHYNDDGEKALLTSQTADQRVMEEYDKIYDNTFSATIYGLEVYFDANEDGEKDEITEISVQNQQATLATTMWNKIKANFEAHSKYYDLSIADAINNEIRAFNTATTGEYATAKKSGLRVKAIASQSVNADSTQPDVVKEVARKIWDTINTFKINEDSVSTVINQSISPVYRFVKNSKVYTVTPFGAYCKEDGTTIYDFDAMSDVVYAENTAYKVIVTSTASKTTYSSASQTPSLYIYEQYQKASEDRELTISCSTQITTYYSPAVINLTGDEAIQKCILELTDAVMGSVQFSSDYESLMNTLNYLLEQAKIANGVELD